jgi:hypothetical protein
VDKSIKYCSLYTEKSLKGLPFKKSDTYNINWAEMLDISKKCGMVSFVEFTVDDTRYKITCWAHKDSYEKWSQNPYVRKHYIDDRDRYNQEYHINQNLIFGEVDKIL